MCAKHRPPGEPGPSRWYYASLDPCWLFFTVLYAVDAVDGIILELVVSIKTNTQFLCLAQAHLASSVPCAAFLGNHCCPQWFQMSREVAWSILGELHRRGLGFCTERQETGSTLNLRRCIQGLNSQVPHRGEHSSNCSFTEMKSQSW